MASSNKNHGEFGNGVFEKYNALNYLWDFINTQLPTPQERRNWQQISHLYLKHRKTGEHTNKKEKIKMNTVTTTLTDLPKTLENKKLQDFATEIVRYQKFRTTAALEKISFDYDKPKACNLFNAGVSYIKNNKRYPIYKKDFYNFIDNAISKHIQPLTPTEAEKRIVHQKRYTKPDALPPIAKLDIVNKPLTSKFEYGIRFGNEIKLFNSKDEAKGFIQGVKYAGVFTGKLVEVEIKEVDND